MFRKVNDLFTKLTSNEKDNRFIVEAVVGDNVIPFSDEEDAEIIDVDSIDNKTMKKVDDEISKLIDTKDFDDVDIDDMVDDDDDGAIDELIDQADVKID